MKKLLYLYDEETVLFIYYAADGGFTIGTRRVQVLSL
jgi:hypothetical protein